MLKICLLVLTEFTNVTDRQTDRQTDTAWRYRPCSHSIAWQKWKGERCFLRHSAVTMTAVETCVSYVHRETCPTVSWLYVGRRRRHCHTQQESGHHSGTWYTSNNCQKPFLQIKALTHCTRNQINTQLHHTLPTTFQTVAVSLSVGLNQQSCATSDPVSTKMGDRLRADKPSRYVTSHPGRLSLLPQYQLFKG